MYISCWGCLLGKYQSLALQLQRNFNEQTLSVTYTTDAGFQVVYVGFLGYYMPFLTMIGAYSRILYVMRKRARKIRDSKKVQVATVSAVSGGHWLLLALNGNSVDSYCLSLNTSTP